MGELKITYSFEDPFEPKEEVVYDSFESFLGDYPMYAGYFKEERVRNSNQKIIIQNEDEPFEEIVKVEWS